MNKLPLQVAVSASAPNTLSSWNNKADGAAVTMLFAPMLNCDNIGITFIKRSMGVSTHKGQIGFPGGHCEQQDDTPIDTALRELEEEIGVKDVVVHGYLEPVKTLRGKLVYPILTSTICTLDQMRPQSSEVDQIFIEDWKNFSRSSSSSFWVNFFGRSRLSRLYQSENVKVWGLTAQMIYNAEIM